MIGQEELINLINSKTLDTLPKSILISGDKGSGKHMITKYIADTFNLTEVELKKEHLNFEFISELYLKPEPYLYLINGNNLNEQRQNALLKFVEEPLKNSFIVIIIDDVRTLLPTIINRCVHYKMKRYSQEILETFVKENYEILKYATTPGQVIEYESIDIKPIEELCDKIFTKIDNANFPNILTIPDKINFGDEADKIDLTLFMKILNETVYNMWRENSLNIFKKWELTRELEYNMSLPKIDKKVLFENYLAKMKVACNEYRAAQKNG